MKDLLMSLISLWKGKNKQKENRAKDEYLPLCNNYTKSLTKLQHLQN